MCGVGFLLPLKLKRSTKLGWIIALSLQTVLTVIVAAMVKGYASARDASDFVRGLEQSKQFVPAVSVLSALLCAGLFLLAPTLRNIWKRIVFVAIVGAVAATAIGLTWKAPPPRYLYMQRELAGEIEAIYTVVPWSPSQRVTDRSAQRLEPGESAGSALAETLTVELPLMGPIGADGVDTVISGISDLPLRPEQKDDVRTAFQKWAEEEQAARAKDPKYPELDSQRATSALRDILYADGQPYYLGTDNMGQDVLSQIMHASRLSISIGLVSTGIAVLIGVTLGALMGYFGGWIDMMLYRVVEVFMAIPVLFTLIVAAGVLPRNTYVMMAIIGCFTWHYAARFTRAEFLKLRNQDFVQSARAAGLPLRSILFKHMLPNGVTPVLVDSSFRIALAILFEAILSFLGLGPVDQPSWGRLLSDAAGDSGAFAWWLAIFPGFAIFLTVLAYNLLGEALRDAIDPKLRKARV